MESLREGFKIWKNPGRPEEPPVYMGEFYPPDGQVCFYQQDLKDLGFPPGRYTIRVPDAFRQRYVLSPWQGVEVLD